MYARLVLEGQIEDEPRQRELARRLGGLQERLRVKSREMEAKNTWWGSVAHKAAELSRTITPRPVVGGGGSWGVYIYGGVGVGKSLLMDLFFSSLPTRRKRRTHYHAFMNDVHRQAHLITQRAGYRGDVMKVYIVT
jgi:predicted ATPase